MIEQEVDDDPLIFPPHMPFFFMKNGNRLIYLQKTTQNKDTRQTDIQTFTHTQQKTLPVLTHNTPHKQLTTLHTHQNFAMVI